MFGIGFSELILLALVAVVLIKPDDLPGFFRKAGKFYGKIKAAYKEVVAVKDDFLREMEVGAAVGESADPAKKPESQALSASPAATEKDLKAGNEAGETSDESEGAGPVD